MFIRATQAGRCDSEQALVTSKLVLCRFRLLDISGLGALEDGECVAHDVYFSLLELCLAKGNRDADAGDGIGVHEEKGKGRSYKQLSLSTFHL